MNGGNIRRRSKLQNIFAVLNKFFVLFRSFFVKQSVTYFLRFSCSSEFISLHSSYSPSFFIFHTASIFQFFFFLFNYDRLRKGGWKECVADKLMTEWMSVKCHTYRLQMIFGAGNPSARQVMLIFWFSRTATDDGVLSMSKILGGTVENNGISFISESNFVEITIIVFVQMIYIFHTASTLKRAKRKKNAIFWSTHI